MSRFLYSLCHENNRHGHFNINYTNLYPSVKYFDTDAVTCATEHDCYLSQTHYHVEVTVTSQFAYSEDMVNTYKVRSIGRTRAIALNRACYIIYRRIIEVAVQRTIPDSIIDDLDEIIL